jgi:hypothetical protein
MPRHLRIAHEWVSSRHAPLYELTFPAAASDERVAALCRALEFWHARYDHPYAWVFNLSLIEDAPAVQRQMFRDHMVKVRDHETRFHQGVGLVVPNAFLRGLVTATFWFVQPKFKHEAFASHEQAFDWARRQLEAKGLRTG